MDKLSNYRTLIIELLKQYIAMPSVSASDDELEEQLILDREHDHYQILAIGWQGAKRIYYPVFHLDIKNGKIWVQEDATDFDIVGELENRGVPKSDIVLAFHAPYRRPHTDYAAA
ncbi:MAG: XisI protein [Bacteroidia bacterium]|nr:XisI protein [Bacteroidia bacterium]